jgi:hypothetical protein
MSQGGLPISGGQSTPAMPQGTNICLCSNSSGEPISTPYKKEKLAKRFFNIEASDQKLSCS